MESYQDKHTIGGALTLISGVFGVLGTLVLIFIILFFRYASNHARIPEAPGIPLNNLPLLLTLVYGLMGLGFLVLGVLGIVGGIFALKKIHWGVALAGAIAGTLTFYPCGIAALIFISMAKPEFFPPRLNNLPGV